MNTVIEGIIGAGKTEIIQQLSKKTGYIPFYEPIKENPYLGPFYEDPRRWAFPMQMELLLQRAKIEQQAFKVSQQTHRVALLDRSLLGDFVFAKVNWIQQNISPLEWKTYLKYYNHLRDNTDYDLIIYLEVDPIVAKQRLEKRNRIEEKNIPLSYYESLDHTYHLLLKGYKQTVYVDWNQPNRDIQIIQDVIAKAVYQ